MPTPSDAQAIVDVSVAHGSEVTVPYQLGRDRYAFVVPAGYTVKEVSTEADQAVPPRAKGTVTLTTTDSFVTYVQRHSSLSSSTLYADVDALSVVAVLNDHGTSSVNDDPLPGWRDFRAVLKLSLTPAWRRWTGAHGHYLTQEAFAELIDSGMTEIASPPGADLLEMSQTIKVSKSANFRSQQVRKSGQVQLTYVEEVDGRAGKDGNLTIPDAIQLVLPPFEGADPVGLTARVRYKLDGPKLAIGVWLDRPAETLRSSFDAELVRIGDRTELDVLWGTP